MLEIYESCIQEEMLREVRDSYFFSIITDDVVDIAKEKHLPVLVRFVDESHNLREEFGKNLQGPTSDVCFAASSLTAMLHSLNEVMENIKVYHEFWFEEATNLANKLDIQMKLPGKFHRAQQGNLDSQLSCESYYKETLSVPTVEHIIQELKDIYAEQHLRDLKCLSLVPSVMGQLKFNTSEVIYPILTHSQLSFIVGESSGNKTKRYRASVHHL
jgi:hypothetical protein